MSDVRCTVYDVRDTIYEVRGWRAPVVRRLQSTNSPVARRLQSTNSFNLQIACVLVSISPDARIRLCLRKISNPYLFIFI